MNTEAGRPTPPPLPGRAASARQRVLQVILCAAIVVLVIVSIVFALVLWKFSFSTDATTQTAPTPERAFTPPVAPDSLLLHVQSSAFNVLRGERLTTTGAGGVEVRAGHLAVHDTARLRPQNAITVSAWFNARSYDQPMTVAGRAQTGPPWRYPFLSWLVRINTESLMEIDVGHAQNYTPSGWNVPPLQPNQWYFVAMTFDGQTKKLFLNESHITSMSSGSPNSQPRIHYTPGRAILIGADESDAPVGDRFQGMIDDVRIYDRALSAEEVQQVFQEGARRLPLRR